MSSAMPTPRWSPPSSSAPAKHSTAIDGRPASSARRRVRSRAALLEHRRALGQVVGLAQRRALPGFPVRQQLRQLGAQPLGLRIRRHAELALEHVTAAAVLVERRAHPVLVHVQADQRAMDALLQRIERDQAQRHLNRAIDGAGDHIVVEQTPQDLVQRFVQPPSLGQQPFFERLAAVGEALEKLAPIEVGGAFQSLRACRRRRVLRNCPTSTSTPPGRTASWFLSTARQSLASSGRLWRRRESALRRLARASPVVPSPQRKSARLSRRWPCSGLVAR